MTEQHISNVVLLTNYFPFDKGEEYLEAELPIIASTFTSVTVIPLMTTTASTQTRELPDNVKLIEVNGERGMPLRILDLVRQVASGRKGWDGFRAAPGGRRVIEKAFDAYFESRAVSVLDRLIDLEPTFRPAPGTPITIYSYWFYLTARVGAGLKNRWSTTNPLRFVSRGHGYDVNIGASAINYLPEREYLLDQVDELYPVSASTTRWFREEYPQFSRKVHTRRLGSSAVKDFSQAKQEPLHIISCSTIRSLKRLEVIADAVEQLLPSVPDTVWTHIGSGTTDYATKLEKDIKARLGSAVRFEGQMSNSEVHRWYQENEATAFVNVSKSEGVPVSIMEAMSYSLPIIATDVGGTSELFSPSMFDGILPKDLSGDDLREALIRLHSASPDDYSTFAAASREEWESSWNSERNFEDFMPDLARLHED